MYVKRKFRLFQKPVAGAMPWLSTHSYALLAARFLYSSVLPLGH
jgi:hypothetical protein